MTELSQIGGQGQIQQQTTMAIMLQTQSIIMMQTQELEQEIDLKLMQNPALYLEDPLENDEDPLDLQEEDEDQWDEDFDKPFDEYETGDRYVEDNFEVDNNMTALKRIAVDRWSGESERLKEAIKAIDDYRHSGDMTDNAMLKDLVELEAAPLNKKSFFKRPDIKVTIDNGQVEVCLSHNKGNNLKYKSGMGNDTKEAKAFIKDIEHRKRVLQKLCDLVLMELQKDFFLEQDPSIALLNLLPISVSFLCDLITDDLFQTKLASEKFIYKSENLIVSCGHGNFPFNLFFPNEPPILRLWMREAEKNGKIKQEEQRQWIKSQIEKRVSVWSPDDKRLDLIKPLIKMSIDNIKYASKSRHH